MYKGIIYKCECLKTDKVYIGLTILQFEERKRCHIKDSYDENCIGYNYHFHRAIRKYGIENFTWERNRLRTKNIYRINLLIK